MLPSRPVEDEADEKHQQRAGQAAAEVQQTLEYPVMGFPACG
jgi:hypothetical protein